MQSLLCWDLRLRHVFLLSFMNQNMALIPTPLKPFPNYKWRWATLTPTESLNRPSLFLGVLRVLARNEFAAPSSDEVNRELRIVQAETNSPVDLVRTTDRNIIRNSGQYWKALGLIDDTTRGKIILTEFGRGLAKGEVTQVEFSTAVVKTFELPNRRIETNVSEWDAAGLKIKPFELVLRTLVKLSQMGGKAQAFITPEELVKIIIPLAGAKATVDTHADAILQYRNGSLDVTSWPDCAPEANDKRMAAEYLLFLTNYGFISLHSNVGRNAERRYFLSDISSEEVLELESLPLSKGNVDVGRVVKEIRLTHIPAIIERRKVSREVLERPYQAAFRKNVLSAYRSSCLVTGVSIESVLEAAHIVPVKDQGSDQIDNGICLRSDIHQLFDSGHIRLQPNGQIVLSTTAAQKNNYDALPREIDIPPFVDRAHLEWRMKYL